MKIARWNDINFYQLKHAVAQSHKTVWKFGRKYRKQITQPVNKMLKDLQEADETVGEKSSEEVLPINLSAYLVEFDKV